MFKCGRYALNSIPLGMRLNLTAAGNCKLQYRYKSVLFLFFCDIITIGNDVSHLEIENCKNKADDVYDLFCRRNQLFNFYDRREII